MRFADLRLAEPILRAVHSQGYTTATPIQAQAIGPVLDGKDVLGCAQTGTGKTAAFALPILQRLAAMPRPSGHAVPLPRCLILCPTRELAIQIGESFEAYGQNLKIHHAVLFGGVSQVHQVTALRRGVDIIIATPGRLLDLMSQRHASLKSIDILVLDEADRMLDMGFIPDIRRVIAELPAKRQTLFFSATMPREIRELAEGLLHDPVKIHVAPDVPTADGIDQTVYFVPKKNKAFLLAHLVDHLPMSRAIVFVRTKRGADRVVRLLHKYGVRAEAIHSDKSQGARQRAMERFRTGKIPLLIATDIASRGIDVDGISHVVNYDLTHEPETYVHRIGRTARAGASGAAVSLCDDEEFDNLKAIEKLIRKKITVCDEHPEYPKYPAPEGAGKAGHNHSHPRHSHEAPAQAQHHAHAPRQSHAPSNGRPRNHPHAAKHNHAPAHRQGAVQHAQGSKVAAIEFKSRGPHQHPRSQGHSTGSAAHRPMGAKHRPGGGCGPRRNKMRRR